MWGGERSRNVGRLVLIPKEKKLTGVPPTYRPICLLAVVITAKTMERIEEKAKRQWRRWTNG